MEIRVKLFALLRERAGRSEITVTVPDPSTAADILTAVTGRFPDLERFCQRVAVAVNLETVPRSAVVRAGDEVALIPPVSGGAR